MASTTYHHLGDITKMVCARFRGFTKTYHLGNVNKMVTFCHQFAVLGNMVRRTAAAAFLARCCLWRRLVWCCHCACKDLTDSR